MGQVNAKVQLISSMQCCYFPTDMLGMKGVFAVVASSLMLGVMPVRAQVDCIPPPGGLCARLKPNMVAFAGQAIESKEIKPVHRHEFIYFSEKVATFKVLEPVWGLDKGVKTIQVHFLDWDERSSDPLFFVVKREASGDYVYNDCLGGVELTVDDPWVDEFRRHVRDMDPVTLPVRVVTAITYSSLPNAEVQLQRNSKTFKGTTSNDGRLEFSGVTPGTYSLEARRAKYLFPKELRSISILPGSCAELTIPMQSLARISGQILDSSGNPVRNVRGFDLISWSTDQNAQDYSNSRPFETDAEGKFAVDGVAPGSYYMGSNIWETREPRKGIFPRTYYPGVARRENATPLTIGPGDRLDGVVFRLPDYGKKRRLTVRVMSADGVPVEHAIIEDGPAEMSEVKVASIGPEQFTDNSGKATFDLWAASEYRVDARLVLPNTFHQSEIIAIPADDSDTETTIVLKDLLLRAAPK